ncbi:MAG TPA: hypothetical protein VM487_06515 [Phycisphaerae bacterium]|nr:hypothetical protein [Phycisphaerae bacterium]
MPDSPNLCSLEVCTGFQVRDWVFAGIKRGAERRGPRGFPPPDKPRERIKIASDVVEAIKAVTTGCKPWPLVLCGEAGSGKTCAALCMLDHFGGGYTSVGDLCAQINGFWDQGDSANRARLFWNKIEDCYLMVLDELGQRKTTSDARNEVVKKFLDVRIDLPNPVRPTVVISNLTLDEMSCVYPDPIISRLAGGTVVTTSGDRRVIK